MKHQRIAFVLALAAVVVFGSRAVADETIDFEEFSEGDIVSSIAVTGGNVAVNGSNPSFPGVNAAMIFDSSCPPGGVPADCSGEDPDLGTPNVDFGGPGVGAGGQAGSPNQNDTAQGNLLIISEDLDSTDPDDADLVGESIDFDFSALGTVTVKSMVLVDVEAEEPNATVELFDATDTLIAMIVADPVGDNGVGTIGLGPTSGVARMAVTLNGSGAIDDIVFERDEVCGNDMQETGEECDGTDDAACPGACKADCTCPICGDGVVDAGEQCDDGNNVDGDGCDANCRVEQTEGCTPGYWKQRHHLDSWVGAAPGDNFNATFGTAAVFNAGKCTRPDGVASGDPTLLKALWCKGGGLHALARHAVAALLNSLNPGVTYALTSAEVIDLVKAAIESGDLEAAKNQLAEQNERGCPLN